MVDITADTATGTDIIDGDIYGTELNRNEPLEYLSGAVIPGLWTIYAEKMNTYSDGSYRTECNSFNAPTGANTKTVFAKVENLAAGVEYVIHWFDPNGTEIQTSVALTADSAANIYSSYVITSSSMSGTYKVTASNPLGTVTCCQNDFDVVVPASMVATFTLPTTATVGQDFVASFTFINEGGAAIESATLGGTVTLRGTATDTIGNNIGVDSVWLQIIPNSDGTTFAPTMNDVKLWVDNGYEVYQNTSGNKITSVTGSTASGANYYIKATFSGSAWNLKINGKSEFNPASGSTKNIAYRIYAKDKDGNLSNYEQQYSIFDSDNPVISELYLRQYSNNDAGNGNVVASQAYEDDMWVKGTWWLCGKVQDTQGLSSLTVDGNAQTIKGTANAEEEFKYKLETGGTNNAGSVSVTIEAQDKVDQGATPHKAERTLTINFDNKAPELITSGSAYKIDSAVRNSNGFYSFGSQVTEDAVSGSAQSGFSYLAFWFERNISGGKHVVYDVMRSKSNSEVTYSGLTEENGLMWKSTTVTRDDSALGTLKVSAKDENIHVGGLCKIGGTIYIISSVSSDGKTININGQPEKSYTTALFAIANVVDNTIESARGAKSSADGQYGYYTTISNDDGDHMVESVEKSGTTWTWEANINSQNIADGTVTLHYVAFDKAGNYKEGTVSGM